MKKVSPLVRNTLLAIYTNTFKIPVRYALLLILLFLICIADRNNLSLNSMKKRQRTKKFPMTAGSWTGPEGPTGKICTVSSGVTLSMVPVHSSNT